MDRLIEELDRAGQRAPVLAVEAVEAASTHLLVPLYLPTASMPDAEDIHKHGKISVTKANTGLTWCFRRSTAR